MNSIKTDYSFLETIIFPPTLGVRILHHVCFWIIFVALHFGYSLPTLTEVISDPRFTLVGVIYFFKFLPNYYLCVALYYFLSRHFRGFALGLAMFVCTILLLHTFNTLLFIFVDMTFGLETMPERFRMIGELHLKLLRFEDPLTWTVFAYDLSELELLLLPATLKVGKYAARQTLLRQKLQNEALSMELKVLKTQINPHFVFNVLNAAYAKILPISEEAAEYLQKSSEIIRFALYEANEEFIKLEKEIAYLNQYVELESVRNTRRCMVSFIQEGMIRDSHEIPTLLLITLVENAFKHGVHASRHPSFVAIKIFVHPEKLECSILNSVPERSPEEQAMAGQGTGLGLANLRKRLEIYYPGRYQFETVLQDQTFKVTLALPLTAA
ncbi:sensor histidine kinase [Dyadobacter sp. CY347]|uniref:sensor histidine kinase n=1 Tax=Dyadobacter sp. CY347 TaxID=2909336 RepID=UPI001F41D171|nr:histidine kinase [Dyadobacter sp. CY347]MCF2489897.1 histidine kinase [Dyadobacter sp. CY347]